MSPRLAHIVWLLLPLTVSVSAPLWAQERLPTAQANAVHPDLNIDVAPVESAPPMSHDDPLAELARRLVVASAQESAEPIGAVVAPAARAPAPELVAPPQPAESTVIEPVVAITREVPTSPNEQLRLGPASASGGKDGEGVTPIGPSSSWMLSTMAALGLVIGLVFLLRAVVCRLTGRPIASGHSPVIEVLSRVSVAPRSHVLIVRLGQRILVLGDGAGGLRTLAQLDDPDEVAEVLGAVTASRPNSVTQSFAHLVSRFSGDYDLQRQSEEGGDKAEIRVDQARDQVSSLLSRVRAMAKGT